MRWGVTLRNQTGMAGVIAAMLLVLLNAAVWMVINTGSERVSIQRTIRAALSKKSNQLIVDNGATLVADYCNALILGTNSNPSPTPLVSEGEFRANGLDLSQNFRALYEQMGFRMSGTEISFKAYPIDSHDRLPSSATPILSGLQATLKVGSGAKLAERTFTLPVLMNSVGGQYSVIACKNDEESSRCYLNSMALYNNLPAPEYVIRPTTQAPALDFDTEINYGRVQCFSETLRLPEAAKCNSESNTLAMGLRVCMSFAQALSRFVVPVPPNWGAAGQICLNISNFPRILQSCPVGGGPVL